MKRALQAILAALRLILTGKSDSAADAGICDFSGQGRDKNGR